MFPIPALPVHRVAKFFTVFGTVSPNRPITTLPFSTTSPLKPSISISRYAF